MEASAVGTSSCLRLVDSDSVNTGGSNIPFKTSVKYTELKLTRLSPCRIKPTVSAMPLFWNQDTLHPSKPRPNTHICNGYQNPAVQADNIGGKRSYMEKFLWWTQCWNNRHSSGNCTNKLNEINPNSEDTNRARRKTNEKKGNVLLGWFIQCNRNTLQERKHMLTDLNRTLAQSGPDEELAEEEFNKTLRRSRKDTSTGLDTIPYLDKKNLTEVDRADIWFHAWIKRT